MSKNSKLFFLSRTFPVWSTGVKFPGRCWAQQGSSAQGQSLPAFSFRLCSGQDTGLLPVLQLPLFVFSLRSYWWCCPVGAAGKAAESGAFWKAFWMLAYALQARFQMDPNYSCNWTSRQASKCKYFPGTFFWEKWECTAENQACLPALQLPLKNVAYIGDQWQTKRFVIPHLSNLILETPIS